MSGFHSNDYFVLKNQLDAETRQKLQTLVPTFENESDGSTPRIPPCVYVIEWMSDGNAIYAFGCDARGRTVKLPVNVRPGVFAISSNVPLLRTVCALHDCDLEVYERFKYRCNNFAPWDILMDYDYPERETALVKICASSVSRANEMFYKFRREEEAYRYVSVPLYWSPTKQILFERLVKYCRENDCVTYEVPRITMRWFDAELNCYRHPEPQLPVITFDIETVSTDPNRVPYGEHADDELFTVSVHHTHTNVLYTLAYLPLDNGTRPEAMLRMIREDGYPEYPELAANRLECFASERDLLRRTMELLTLPDDRLHILVGYNSMSYDIKYLFLRCAFYNLELPKSFVYREGYAYGFSQIHLDLFRIVMSQYRLKNYSLNNVSKLLLKDTKTGVDAVKLRYTFHAIRHYGRYFGHDECVKWPSVRDTLHYNNYDTILVSKLLKRANSIEFTLNQAHECRIELSALNSNYNKMRFKLWSKCFVVGLEIGVFQSTFKSSSALFRLPLYDMHSPVKDYVELRVPLNEQLQGNAISAATADDRAIPFKYQLNDVLQEKKAKYPGGANFCLGEYVVDDVQMLDYRIAYPLLIDRQNISDETATILPANLIRVYLERMPCERWRAFRTFDYLAHTGNSRSETAILYHRYIYEGLYCGGEFPCTLEELSRRNDSPVVIIWQGRRGILSDIITRFNTIREDTKNTRKLLDGVIALIEDRIGETLDEREAMRSYENADRDETRDSGVGSPSRDNVGNANDDDGDFGVADAGTPEHKENEDDDDGDFGVADAGTSEHKENEDDDGDFGVTDAGKSATTEHEENEDDGDFGMGVETTAISNDDDDGDFGFEEATNVAENDNETVTLDSSANDARQDSNPFGFKFVNRYIAVYANRTAVLDDSLLRELSYDEQLAVLEDLKRDASVERDSYQNSYELQKSLVASIYGCIGTSSPVCAALITNGIRSTILQAAQYVASKDYTVYYIDTDSLFIKHPSETRDLSPELNHRFPHTEIEMKLYRRCLFVQKKTYYTVTAEGSLKYFQHVNGSPAWRDFVQYVYQRSDVRTNEDVYRLFVDFYESVYDRLLAFDRVTPELQQLIAQDVKLKMVYKTNTHLAKLKLYLQKHYPALAGSYRQTVYYIMESDVKQTAFRPIAHLKDVRELSTVNMFKYYQNVFKTIFNLIKFHVRANNRPFVVTVSPRQILLAMINAYLDVHARRFPEAHIDAESVNASRDIDDYEFLQRMQNDEAEDEYDEASTVSTSTQKRKSQSPPRPGPPPYKRLN